MNRILHRSAMARFLGLASLLWLAAGVARSPADERILSFHSDIVLQEDGSMTVTETITVRAERKQIRRGIYRDFPTRYKDRWGNTLRVVNAAECATVAHLQTSWSSQH